MSEHRFKHKHYTMACKMLQYYIPDIFIQYKILIQYFEKILIQ